MGVAKQMEINQTRYDEKLLITTEIIKKTEEITIYRYIKRIIDIVISIIGIILLIPIIAILWIANFVSKDNGPIFYTQDRIGKNGKYFKLYKFRSMVVGADEKLTKYLAENEEARKEYRKYKK